jgi:hypothetical protein
MKWLKHFLNIFYYFPGGNDAWYAMKLHHNYERRRAKMRKKVYNQNEHLKNSKLLIHRFISVRASNKE